MTVLDAYLRLLEWTDEQLADIFPSHRESWEESVFDHRLYVCTFASLSGWLPAAWSEEKLRVAAKQGWNMMREGLLTSDRLGMETDRLRMILPTGLARAKD